jgi:hypothetical protein
MVGDASFKSLKYVSISNVKRRAQQRRIEVPTNLWGATGKTVGIPMVVLIIIGNRIKKIKRLCSAIGGV